VLVELGLLEQRHKAVPEVLNGATVVDVARRYGVARDWLRRYARNGMAALADRSSKLAESSAGCIGVFGVRAPETSAGSRHGSATRPPQAHGYGPNPAAPLRALRTGRLRPARG
jgi:hypothetical protein